MNIENKLVMSVISGLKALYGQDVPAVQVQLQKTKKEFEGQKKGQNQKPRIGENAKINEELAKMAAQQEMIRKMMQQYSNDLKEEGGKSAGELDNLIKQMEQTETDIVNKIINQQTINRQNNMSPNIIININCRTYNIIPRWIMVG